MSAPNQIDDTMLQPVVPLTPEHLSLLVKALSRYNDVEDYREPYASKNLIELRKIVGTWNPGLPSSN
jgi:hypothetical protein